VFAAAIVIGRTLANDYTVSPKNMPKNEPDLNTGVEDLPLATVRDFRNLHVFKVYEVYTVFATLCCVNRDGISSFWYQY
jgi:hypothetical protein